MSKECHKIVEVQLYKHMYVHVVGMSQPQILVEILV